ncbi:sortase-associated OmpA-like protein PdsO [Colwellia sp. MB02u-18]|uniref:sortase-associated OmpA-like protein PdsO n=1 Tax=unclassified Colwellia TaxID=196834 RepID=UPI0015F4418B|nr:MULTISPECIES: sortase-associated OmpA-like protein PdsO [unclassified Colwellia]MBA6224943.1 sortase-associated OmpA-like protein PdsO [Colwellia sp. MB3u-45]MBA6268769.1 sortase-associated OmpA-like protein PdsO [Colwellia sp. MB3u-43]MBA6321200.1 sortase-associated OmpA-like protein PdsO [Colwellia sp. MB02u-19]MBA6325753.1 sortase-associated OmpA-like protein PdsO [Colwellia sp. MB02u-18]MBA6332228.1 sortase-associated OmpA-like protein PdsO [Colwellia sp. MB02u-12]
MMTTKLTTANNPSVSKTSRAKTLLNVALISALTVSPVFASSYEKTAQDKIAQESSAQLKEEIGFGTGMVIGAILGGPIGAFITGVAGNMIAKNINATDEIESLSTAYSAEKKSNEISLARYQRQIEQAEQSYQTELLALEQNYQAASNLQAQNLLMSLQFSTGSSEIKSHYQEQIESLARIVQQSPNLTLDLSGYTDKQGSDTLNQALSLARINAVKNALIDQGVKADRISLFAFGEQQSVVASVNKEVSFYDRRVVIKLKNTALANDATQQKNSQTAQNF